MTAPGPDEVTAFFAEDHRRIDALLERFRAEAEPGRARPSLDAFEAVLLRHIAWEERDLFPAFEAKLGEEARVCAVSMRVQHEELKQRLAELRPALESGGAARRNAEEVLVEALADHNHAEEGFIYPWMDSVLSQDERRELLASLTPPAPSTEDRAGADGRASGRC